MGQEIHQWGELGKENHGLYVVIYLDVLLAQPSEVRCKPIDLEGRVRIIWDLEIHCLFEFGVDGGYPYLPVGSL